MNPSADEGAGDELSQIQDRARRRWMVMLVVFAVAGGLGGGLGPTLFGGQHHHQSGGQHHVVVGVVVGAAVLAVAAGSLIWMVRRVRRNQGMFAAPLAGGLPRRRRRAVTRAIRRGVPSENAVERTIERETANRLLTQAPRALIIFPLFILGELAEAIFGDHNSVGQIFFYAAAAMFAVAFVWQQYLLRRARIYLTKSAN